MPAAPSDRFPRLTRFKTPEEFRCRLRELGLELPVDERLLSAAEGSPMARPLRLFGREVGNRWCIQPMEGWDGTPDGKASEHTLRRWRNFGLSGAKLIFGGEAVAVCRDGRANPRQLLASPENRDSLAGLLAELRRTHRERFGSDRNLLVGLQLTHSGRFSRPEAGGKPRPRILYHHPILDSRVGVAPDDDSAILSDGEIDRLIDEFVRAARMAAEIGYDFVDIKHCHGYLGHEFLSAHTRPGRYGGSLENRTRFLRVIGERIRSEAPGLEIAVRVSAFDLVPFQDDPSTREGRKKGFGIPVPFRHCLPYDYGFGVNRDNPLQIDLSETFRLFEIFDELDIRLINISCASPYYNPHLTRPAYFPPSDGYRPPEDPLVGVERQIRVAREIHRRFPRQVHIGSAYTYLQEFLPLVAQAVVREGWIDLVGLGRQVLVYPELPADTLEGRPLQARKLCRTFSDCTTAPRHGLISGCYPLDEYYRRLPEAEKVKEIRTR